MSVTSVPAGVVDSAPAASTWTAGKEPADMDAKEGKLPLPAYWDSRNVSSIHVDREDPTDRKDESSCQNYFKKHLHCHRIKAMFLLCIETF